MHEMPLLVRYFERICRMKKNRKDSGESDDHGTDTNRAMGDYREGQFLKLPDNEFINQNSSRRDFLKVLGFSFVSAAIIASCKRPVLNALPYIIQPPEMTPGKSSYYASTYYDGHDYASILVKTHDGRPIKIEGNNLSPFNREGTTARVQASVLSLYDDARLKNPTADQLPVTWEDIDKQIISELTRINSKSGEVVLLSSSIISPTTIKLIQEFGAGFKKFRWVQYDPLSYSAILEANAICFGKRVIPDYHFRNVSKIVSINADFLGTWLCPVHFIPDYVSRRKLDRGEKDMVHHTHFESGMSLTGANADIRRMIKPSEEKRLLVDLYNRIAEKTGAGKLSDVSFKEDLSDLADGLVASKGRSIVVSGTNSVDIQIIVNSINNLLDNYSSCIDLDNNIKIASGTDTMMENLARDMNEGKISGLLMYNVNPVYDYTDSERFLKGIENTELTVNMTIKLNETVGKARYECPVNHYLESWDDAEIIPGQLSLSQPCINQVFDTRCFQDSLLKWSGSSVNYHDYLIDNWKSSYFPHSGSTGFRDFWNRSLQNGVFSYPVKEGKQIKFNKESLLKPGLAAINDETGFYEVSIVESVPLGTGMHANNPWLMELPDPVSRHCWENVASISVKEAQKLGIQTGDVIKLTTGLILPALIQPGQAEGTVSVALGYGHTNSGPVCKDIGSNLYPFAGIKDGSRQYHFVIDKLEKTEISGRLALTQIHSSMEGRPIVRDTVFSRYKESPSAGNELHKEFEDFHKTMYPDIRYDGFHWGMAIDLNSCIGCNSCVIACQAENNIPVVGKDQVIRRRIMHWMRIDRYYSDLPDDLKVFFQPVACQHCDNAPCENVCPVSATNHSSEGLNQMAYNRCIGTKYCINNCPYRVRRFNWYRYTGNKVFDFNSASELGRMVLNPDVTVRERGVVEKCSFCVQRIQEKKLQAKLENRTLKDFEIKTACMQACPSNAIVFGNLNDMNSEVSRLFNDQRRYHLLEELHTLPSVGYLLKVRNDSMG
jgi:Fe-S-cluster-containing dehydrogenase component